MSGFLFWTKLLHFTSQFLSQYNISWNVDNSFHFICNLFLLGISSQLVSFHSFNCLHYCQIQSKTSSTKHTTVRIFWFNRISIKKKTRQMIWFLSFFFVAQSCLFMVLHSLQTQLVGNDFGLLVDGYWNSSHCFQFGFFGILK